MSGSKVEFLLLLRRIKLNVVAVAVNANLKLTTMK
tara:strand:- start:149 stop:253 length:105 start_codon:yes stop_codon:yes gene_type:complete